MLGLRRVPIAYRSRLKALRGLYIRYNDENTPEVRGLRLLRAWLSPSQFEQFNVKAHFEVVGCATGTRYRIYYGIQMNIHELDDAGRPETGWCFVPQGRLVPGDVMLAQKIALETSEIRALSVAKRFVPNRRARDDHHDLARIRQVLSVAASFCADRSLSAVSLFCEPGGRPISIPR